ncbi:hypothetical protein [Geomicrobium sp. JCM 19039]|uniref:hypothetical protein n=1 Tax=Geomicrobium sp. JCM 19039 TaxID=1460636 RepID=UPI00045F4B8E|nr:hypothetical protein [Geomicrobium sp. JCM 19039]GAK11563.1 hypothetical protein JCM19039_1267 [Geomicrobium sp. JCM 19039]
MWRPFRLAATAGLLSVVLVACGDDSEEVDVDEEPVEDSEEETSDEAAVHEGNVVDEDSEDALANLDDVEGAMVSHTDDGVNIDLTLSISEDDATDELFEEMEQEVASIVEERPVDLIIIVDGVQMHNAFIED